MYRLTFRNFFKVYFQILLTSPFSIITMFLLVIGEFVAFLARLTKLDPTLETTPPDPVGAHALWVLMMDGLWFGLSLIAIGGLLQLAVYLHRHLQTGLDYRQQRRVWNTFGPQKEKKYLEIIQFGSRADLTEIMQRYLAHQAATRFEAAQLRAGRDLVLARVKEQASPHRIAREKAEATYQKEIDAARSFSFSNEPPKRRVRRPQPDSKTAPQAKRTREHPRDRATKSQPA